MSKLYNVSASPHTRSRTTTATIMQDVIIALIPATIYGIFNFGIKAFLIILTSVVACVMTEYIYEKAMKKPLTTGDYSAVVTGLLLALNLSPNVPLWIPVIGSVFAILVVKMLYGGIGQNFMNPALAARCFLLISFAGRMNNFAVEQVQVSGSVPKIFQYLNKGIVAVDGVTGATPLASLRAGESVDLLNLFIGKHGGTIGETSVAAILIGAAYLLLRKVITWRIPVTYLASFALFLILFGGKGLDWNFLFSHLFGGGLMLGAFFMATDYTTSPRLTTGKIVFGIGCGLITMIIRLYGSYPEGVSFSILLMNILTPQIDMLFRRKTYGGVKA